jgi:hypothetical protein
MAQQQVVQQLIEGKLLAVAQAVEDSVDDELHRLEKLTEDDLDALRAKRLDQMRNAARRKQQWLERGHGSYADVRDEKVCPVGLGGWCAAQCTHHRTVHARRSSLRR